MEAIIEEATEEILPLLEKDSKLTLRQACYVNALTKLHSHYKIAGIALCNAVKTGKKEWNWFDENLILIIGLTDQPTNQIISY